MGCVSAQTLKEGTDFEKKHVPMIECKSTVKPDEIYEVKIHTAGVEHPMEDGHFIQFIDLKVGEYPLLRVQLTQHSKPDVVVKKKNKKKKKKGNTFKFIA